MVGKAGPFSSEKGSGWDPVSSHGGILFSRYHSFDEG